MLCTRITRTHNFPNGSMILSYAPLLTWLTIDRPERGSFPLDHEGMSATILRQPSAMYTSRVSLTDHPRIGECKHIISGYLKCIKLNRGTNDEACRKLAKDYLACRMDKYVTNFSTSHMPVTAGTMEPETPELTTWDY